MKNKKVLNVSIDEELWKRVKVYCINRGITMTKFVEIALKNTLENMPNELLDKISSAEDSSGSVFEPYKKSKNN
ncbi:MAG: hypothetical protein H0X03_07405 [Nitrosopumilus sp.]|nr:hypothetical protein [Nitrosopumilus sp.]